MCFTQSTSFVLETVQLVSPLYSINMNICELSGKQGLFIIVTLHSTSLCSHLHHSVLHEKQKKINGCFFMWLILTKYKNQMHFIEQTKRKNACFNFSLMNILNSPQIIITKNSLHPIYIYIIRLNVCAMHKLPKSYYY